MKNSVYIETSIVSYLTARPSNDIRSVSQQNITSEWWDFRRNEFDLFISEFVIIEASRGDKYAAAKRLAAIEGIAELEVLNTTAKLARSLISQGSLPTKAEIDAFHVAVAATHGVEFLLTWNCKHIANAIMRPKIEQVCREEGFEPPIICTPTELLEG
jgi:predicted nucleic acid-binding protein